MKTRNFVLIAALGAGMGLSVAHAQDRTLPPNFGTAKLVTGFTPDPRSVEVLAGGSIQARDTIGAGCVGFVADAPDYRIVYTSGVLPLVISVESGADATLVIADPSGNWVCDDDSGSSFNPLVAIESPQSGQYDVWVGTFSEGDFEEATLLISEIPPENALDSSLLPNFGEFDLRAGFKPDPFAVDVVAGGDVDAELVGGECGGYTTAAPVIRINYTAGAAPLYISVESAADTTLIISNPEGNWICDDDSGPQLNPEILVAEPLSGQYDIWIGTFSFGPVADSTVFVSGVEGRAGAGLDWDLDPNYGEVELVAGFSPDPYTLEMLAGGDVAASIAGEGCRGFVTAPPDLRLIFDAGDAPLIISVLSRADTTLVIADPEGLFLCDDDTNGLNPEMVFDPAVTGRYEIWVGTFDPGDTNEATLLISEISGSADTSGAGVIDWSLPPAFGDVELAAGFLPDPFSADLQAGGQLDAASADPACVGHVNAAPDFRLVYQAGEFPLFVWVESDSDATLVISDPLGDWVCDDDGAIEPLDPAIGWDAPASGQYDIWVGTYGEGAAPATLFISEIEDVRQPGLAESPANASPPLAGPGPAAPPADSPRFID